MEINLSLGFLSYLGSALLFLFVLAVYFVGFQVGQKGKPFLLLICASFVWSFLLTLSQIGASIAFEMVVIAEFMRYFTWFYVLQTAAGQYLNQPYRLSLSNPLAPGMLACLFAVSIVTLGLNDYFLELFEFRFAVILQVSWLLIFALIGLVLVEQLFRNTPRSDRGQVIYLCVSAGAIFAYDFFVYSNSVMAQAIDYEFWSARGIVNIFVIPTLVIAAVRNPAVAPNIHISRQFVFHTTTLMAAGGYLVVMSLIGFYIKSSSGEWGKVLQVAFLFATVLLLVAFFLSNTLKFRLKRYLNQNFRNKYDYREEWSRFSQTLLRHDELMPIEKRALQAVVQIVNSQGAGLWVRDQDLFVNKSVIGDGIPRSSSSFEHRALLKILESNEGPIIFESIESDLFDDLNDKDWLMADKTWLIIPLKVSGNLFGFILMAKPVIDTKLDTEDIDLVSTIAHHISLSLFLKETDQALQMAERFKHMNQMTAFLVHDLKTVLSQLALIADNADVHKGNPEFVDDMVLTVKHAVEKMDRLVQQIKNPEQMKKDESFALVAMLEQLLGQYKNHPVTPELVVLGDISPRVTGVASEMASAVKHITQNGIEAVNKDGQVRLQLSMSDSLTAILEISDTGSGMDQEFMVNRLFKPFDSTKGVSGMGVGVYQSREYFRSIGGDISVTSELGQGTCFKLTIPLGV